MAQKDVKMKMDNLLENNIKLKYSNWTTDEKTLYISGYEKRIKEMRTAYISTGCLVDVGVFFVLLILLPMEA